jgi:hypothetical protein
VGPGKNIGIILFTALILLGPGCSSLYFKSAWLDRPLSINEDAQTIPGGVDALYGEKIYIGASNNSQYLWLAMVVKDSDGGTYSNYSHGIAMGGLTVWIDPKGEAAKTLGIRLRGMSETGALQPSPAYSCAGVNPTAVDLASTDLEIINEKGFSTSASTWYLRRFGFESRASYWDRNFILLMKMPLQPIKGSPFPASLATAQTLGIDFESGRLEINKPRVIHVNIGPTDGTTPTPSIPPTPNPFAIPTLVPITLPTPEVSTGAPSAPLSSASAPSTNRLSGPGAGEVSEDPDKLSYWLAIDLARSPNDKAVKP